MDNWLSREENLIGKDKVARLKAKKVAVIGLGGVGSYAAEAIARAGIGQMLLMDGDVVDVFNINRQLIATTSCIGQKKAEIMAKRVSDINPDCIVKPVAEFYNNETDASILDGYDFVVDAIDMVTSKILLIQNCKQKNIPIVSAMGCGNKLDPTGFKIEDISKTKTDPLCRVMRRELRSRGIEHLPVIYSEEPAIKNDGDRVPASISFVPSVAGLVMAGYVIKQLMEEP